MKRILTGFLLVFLFLSQSYGQQTAANFTFNVVCTGETTTLTSTSTVLPGDSIIQYLWDTTWNDGLLNPVLGSPPFGPEVKLHFPGPGVYDIGLKIYTKYDLMESIYKQVAVSDVTADFSTANFCLGDETQFSDMSTGENTAITAWNWTFGDSYSSNDQNPKHKYANFGTYNVSLTVTTINGCTSTTSQVITINDVPHFNVSYSIEPDDVIMGVPQFSFYEGASMTATVDSAFLFTDITWLPTWETGGSIIVTLAGNYSANVTNSNGCKASEEFVVTIKDGSDVDPITIMTPNGDGYNDVFQAKPVILPGEHYELKIYNRYGLNLFTDSNYQNAWDGKDDGGTLVPAGPYYYLLKETTSGKEQTGPINVLYK